MEGPALIGAEASVRHTRERGAQKEGWGKRENLRHFLPTQCLEMLEPVKSASTLEFVSGSSCQVLNGRKPPKERPPPVKIGF